jgi:tRNA threonylcarbamoyl adenosine modification protein YjeE
MSDALLRFALEDEHDTRALGAFIGSALTESVIVGFSGPLGAGKTALVRAIVSAARPDAARDVCSPTWSICNAYGSDPAWLHLDLYRMDSYDDLVSIGYEDRDPRSVVLVEWPEQVPALMEELDVHVRLAYAASEGRECHLVARTDDGRHTLQRMLRRMDGGAA